MKTAFLLHRLSPATAAQDAAFPTLADGIPARFLNCLCSRACVAAAACSLKFDMTRSRGAPRYSSISSQGIPEAGWGSGQTFKKSMQKQLLELSNVENPRVHILQHLPENGL
ncbi:hypothetical protein [Bradyrhizobium sp.]|uniref:hypothetical protein n=1 Tax=Bradyrhizobium sp. TaxID=376 RepID=UPI0026126EE3|nr:hypothetical protein [Bradyrhizobium sp.]